VLFFNSKYLSNLYIDVNSIYEKNKKIIGDKMKDLREKLSEYGTVNACEGDDTFFNVSMKLDKSVTSAVCDCLDAIQRTIGDQYTHTKSCNFDDSNFSCVLRAES